jgi:hypothetical protein
VRDRQALLLACPLASSRPAPTSRNMSDVGQEMSDLMTAGGVGGP